MFVFLLCYDQEWKDIDNIDRFRFALFFLLINNHYQEHKHLTLLAFHSIVGLLGWQQTSIFKCTSPAASQQSVAFFSAMIQVWFPAFWPCQIFFWHLAVQQVWHEVHWQVQYRVRLWVLCSSVVFLVHLSQVHQVTVFHGNIPLYCFPWFSLLALFYKRHLPICLCYFSHVLSLVSTLLLR